MLSGLWHSHEAEWRRIHNSWSSTSRFTDMARNIWISMGLISGIYTCFRISTIDRVSCSRQGTPGPSNLQLDWPWHCRNGNTGEYKLQQKGLLPKEGQHMWVWSRCVEITCQSPISVGTISFWVSPILKHMKHAEVIRMQLDATIFLGAVWSAMYMFLMIQMPAITCTYIAVF